MDITARISTAGRLTIAPVDTSSQWPWPFANGALVSAGGRWTPNCASRLTTYPDQPTAMVAAANRYSRIRFQPTNQAMNSPSVVYEYE